MELRKFVEEEEEEDNLVYVVFRETPQRIDYLLLMCRCHDIEKGTTPNKKKPRNLLIPPVLYLHKLHGLF